MISVFFFFFPEVTELPFGIDDYLETAVGRIRTLAESFPIFDTVLTAFLYYIAFRIGLKLILTIPVIGKAFQNHD